VEELEVIVEADYQAGCIIREKIIPRAVLWYTGEEVDSDDEEDSDDEFDDDDLDDDDHGDDDEDDDEEDDADMPKSKGKVRQRQHT